MTEINIQSGKLRHYLTLQQPTESRDAMGGVTRTWSAVGNLHGEVRPVSAREFVNGERLTQDVTHIIRTRYRAGVTPSMRFTWGGRVFNIEKVINAQESGVMLEFTCIEDLNGH